VRGVPRTGDDATRTQRARPAAVLPGVTPDEAPSDAELALHLAGGNAVDQRRLQELFGDTDWLELTPEAWREAGLGARWVERLAPWRNRAALEWERQTCGRLGVRLLGPRSRDYPACLHELPFPPLLLSVRGRWPPPELALGIVGARAATPTGRQVAGQLGEAAAGLGVTVVSGLARGIDSAALEAAVARGGWTIGVLGCGIDVAYPPENLELQEAIAAGGTLLSEFPLGTRPDRWTFPRRNRLIAALCRVVVVVEAGVRSGALITAAHALEIGREVWAVPGAIDSPQAAGTNQLLFDGAQPLIDPSRLAEMLGLPATAARRQPGDALLRALGRHALTADELAARCREELRLVRSQLIGLELEGRVLRTGGGRWVAR